MPSIGKARLRDPSICKRRYPNVTRPSTLPPTHPLVPRPPVVRVEIIAGIAETLNTTWRHSFVRTCTSARRARDQSASPISRPESPWTATERPCVLGAAEEGGRSSSSSSSSHGVFLGVRATRLFACTRFDGKTFRGRSEVFLNFDRASSTSRRADTCSDGGRECDPSPVVRATALDAESDRGKKSSIILICLRF